ncbi:MAG: hypothetical protein JNM80_11740 [Phycisphaerae bacterium]|nr:hypothetical protein [Phycisphaerae bacterium]
MPIPVVQFKIEFLRLEGVGASIGGTALPFVLGFVHVNSLTRSESHRMGRSRPIPSGQPNFDLTREAVPWVVEVNAFVGDVVTVRAEVWDDKGDAGCVQIVQTQGVISPMTGEMKFVGGPALVVRVSAVVPSVTLPAAVARATSKSGTSATLVVPQALVVEITDIQGLFKPGRSDQPGVKGSVRVPGYISHDDLGRIFTNRKPDDTWQSGEQFIDVEAKVTSVGGVPIPPSSEIKWTLVDVDDPTNDDPGFHKDWGRYVDANDYKPTGEAIGAHDADNASAHSPGNSDEAIILSATAGASATARWEQVPGGPAVTPSSRTEATSKLVAGANISEKTTKIRVHCPNVLGTNFVLRAELTNPPASVPLLNARTGTMTMWSRIDVEVARMRGAHSVSTAITKIPPFLHPACVQLDFQPERIVSDPTLDRRHMAASDATLSNDTAAWVNDSRVFTHGTRSGSPPPPGSQPGWFFFGSAQLPNPLPGGSGPPAAIFEGTTYTITDDEIEVSGDKRAADFAVFAWDIGSTRVTAGFPVRRTTLAGGKTTVEIFGNDVTNGFTGHDADGSVDHAMKTAILFFPRVQATRGSSAFTPGGFGVPAGARLRLLPAGATFTAGISPSATNPATGTTRYFAGRTVIFSHVPSFSDPNPAGSGPPVPKANFDDKVIQTVVHEFVHAFGMPHKCGNWDWRTPRQSSCCMNYFSTWLLDSANRPIPGTTDKQGNHMCGRHLMEIRRVHLDKNLGLNW